MPFPFLPLGALFATAVLGASLVLFGLALKALDRGLSELRLSMLPGLVSGLRRWSREPSGSGAQSRAVVRHPDGIEIVELDGSHDRSR